ncbi:hypothetical protein ASD80_13230 [Devosia sp. Root635]|nr:hypothetical protein ASD80_13230 [Devosia sp. Root635]
MSSNISVAFIPILFFSFLVNILVLTSPLYMMQVYDRVLTSNQTETLIFLSLIALVALAAFGALDAVRGYLLTRLGTYLDLSLRDQVLANAIAQSRQDGTVSRRLIDDLGITRNYLGSPGILPFVDAPWVPFFILIMSLLHPWFGILGVASAALLFFLALANDRLSRRYLQMASTQQAAASEFAGVAIQNAEVIHAMGMQDAISARYRTYVDGLGVASTKAGDIGSIMSGISKAVRVIVQSAALGLGAFLVIRAQMSPGGMIASSILLGRALAPIEQTIGSWRQFVSARESYGRIRGFLNSVPYHDDRISLPNLRGRLAVESLFYKQPNAEKLILRNVSFAVEPGNALALVGPSASGKSTLCRLIVGAVSPTSGNVRLDGADLAGLNPGDVKSTVGYLPQNVELFAGTVRDNIARLGAADDAAVVAAARAAGCHEMVLRLEQGYETELGNRGMFLSGGQRQRIGLARALYGSPSLLVLDEPNSNLDQDGERALIDAIQTAKRAGTAVIVVSHRSTLLQPIDKLGILRDGVLEKFGDRDDVLRAIGTQPPTNAKPVLVPTNEVQVASGKAP